MSGFPLSDDLEQLLGSVLVAEARLNQATAMNRGFLGEGHELLHEGAQVACLRERRLDALVGDQARREVANHRIAVGAGAGEVIACSSVTHGVLFSGWDRGAV